MRRPALRVDLSEFFVRVLFTVASWSVDGQNLYLYSLCNGLSFWIEVVDCETVRPLDGVAGDHVIKTDDFDWLETYEMVNSDWWIFKRLCRRSQRSEGHNFWHS